MLTLCLALGLSKCASNPKWMTVSAFKQRRGKMEKGQSVVWNFLHRKPITCRTVFETFAIGFSS